MAVAALISLSRRRLLFYVEKVMLMVRTILVTLTPGVSNAIPNRKAFPMTKSASRLFTFLLTVMIVACCATLYAQVSPTDGYISLFDGKTLDGWDGSPAVWSVEDDCIVGQSGKQGEANFLAYNQFLTYEGDVPENFVLEFDI